MADLHDSALRARRVRRTTVSQSAVVPFVWEIATLPAHVDDAQKVRYRSLVGENGIPVADYCFPREVSRFDLLATTGHVLVRHFREPIGTLRLAKPSAEVALATNTVLGLEDEYIFDLSPLVPLREELGEVARVALLKRHQKGVAFSKLLAGLIALARQMQVRWLLGTVDCQTFRSDEGELMYEIAKHRGLVHPVLSVEPRAGANATPQPRQGPRAEGFYTAEQRRRGWSGQLAELDLSGPLEVFTRAMNAKIIGRPSGHDHFEGRLVMPVLADLRELPALTRRASGGGRTVRHGPTRVPRGRRR